VRTPIWDRADADARAAIEGFAKEVGAQEIDLPQSYIDLWDAHRAIMAVEMAHNLGEYADRGAVSPQFAELIGEGRRVTATQYLAARRDAERCAEGLGEIFEQIADALITLPARGVAPEGLDATGDPAFCTLWTLARLPAVTAPLLSNADDLPLGVQFIGPANRDERLLRSVKHVLNALGRA
jgi:Asp-tRNA(Asn)/Glu-tRNA(Gln) amidotransferase A subunit family amidase